MVVSDVILVVGLGSPIMSDDAVGLRVVDEIERMRLHRVETRQEAIGGLDIIPVLYGYRCAIIVDAIMTGMHPIGTVMIFDPEDFEPTVADASAHSINLSTAVHMGRRLAPDEMPSSIRYVAVEVEDIQTVGETMTSEVEKAVPNAIDAVVHVVNELKDRYGLC